MSEHTKGPWKAIGFLVFLGNAGGFDLRHCPAPEANARRIVSCVNACEGIPTDALECEAGNIVKVAGSLMKQRDQLLAAIEEALEAGGDGDWQSARKALSAATASVKGEQA